MPDVSELEAARVASSFRPNRKPLIVTIVANAVLALTLLGIPYLRGRSQAFAARRQFADVSRCLMGGDIAPQAGLSLPKGDREHYAAKVMLAGPEWPLSCEPYLKRLAPEEAVFLWPSVKLAGQDLRAAVEMSQRELHELDRRRKAGLRRVPERLLQALRRVQAAVVLLARAGGADADVDNDAITWKGPPRLAAPARLPLMASDEATLDLYSTGTALEALALDGRGVSYLRVADGKVDRERVKRTSFVRGALRSGEYAFLVWAMPDSRCAEREDNCAGRPTGLAPYDKGAAALRDPLWKLSGHPAGRIDRVISWGPSAALLIARAKSDGGAALLRYDVPNKPILASEGVASSLDPAERFELSAAATALDVMLVPGATPAAALALRTDASDATQLSASLVWADASKLPVALPGPVPGEHPWTLGCASARGSMLAYGSERQLRVVWMPPAPDAVREITTQTVALPGALHGENPALDRVRMSCRDGEAQLFWVSATLVLWTSHCTTESCSEPSTLATGVSSFAANRTETGMVVALGNPADEVRVLRLDASGKPLAAPVSPAACFEPSSGMCGTPALVVDAHRIILTARDRSDLLALESTDGGKTFVTLSGFASAAMIEQSTTSPLEQHRKRKGIE